MTIRTGPAVPALATWCGCLAGFQAALALGAPWGAAAWGGTNSGVLSARMRAASAVAAAAWAGTAASLGVPGVIGPPTQRRVLIGVTAFAGLGVLANAASRSPVERAIWVPLSAVGACLGARALRQPASAS